MDNMIDYLPLKRITAMHADEIDEAIAKLVDDDGFYDDASTVYYTDGYEKVAKTLLSKHIEHYMKIAKSEFDMAIETARSDWKTLKNKA
jgi:hypothetical protein